MYVVNPWRCLSFLQAVLQLITIPAPPFMSESVNLLSLIPALFRTGPCCCCCFPCLTPSMSAHGKFVWFPVLEAFSGAYGGAGECQNEIHAAERMFLWLMWWKKNELVFIFAWSTYQLSFFSISALYIFISSNISGEQLLRFNYALLAITSSRKINKSPFLSIKYDVTGRRW